MSNTLLNAFFVSKAKRQRWTKPQYGFYLPVIIIATLLLMFTYETLAVFSQFTQFCLAHFDSPCIQFSSLLFVLAIVIVGVILFTLVLCLQLIFLARD
ncbi:hypothetical protein EGC77_09355 [Shewanella psychromarinicola]|uniref:Uncharacterized protein n=1 Tax=Shewanella psychromarinicola TaxID=2487742 RepID=A0A3N4E9A2_9GAMM|nr:hypothetical protein EGC77_09355 [Shewanella psychromarinicola]